MRHIDTLDRAISSGANAFASGIPLRRNPLTGLGQIAWNRAWIGASAYALGRSHGHLRKKPGRRILALNGSVMERYLTGLIAGLNDPREPHKWTRRRNRPESSK
jgi:hypothetical protein